MNLVGAHVSAAGGVQEAVPRIAELGGTAFALFLKNERRWVSKPMTPESISQFKASCEAHKYNPRTDVLPHGSYLINLANPDAEKREKAEIALLDDLQRCELLNIGLYNLHPGSAVGTDKSTAMARIAESINKLHEKTSFVKVVLENMTGNVDRVVGTRLEDLAEVIELVNDKSRIGVCIDTCHSLTAGYDLRTKDTFDAFWTRFDKIIGYEYLAGIHLNDSKFPYDSRRDVHQNLGLGFVGLETFRLVMNKPELDSIPKVLETPMDEPEVRAEEIELLKWLIGRKADDPEFMAKADALQKKGEKERLLVAAQTEKPKLKQSTFKVVKKLKVNGAAKASRSDSS